MTTSGSTQPEPEAPASTLDPEIGFVLELGRALQTFGASVATLERALERVIAHLGLEGAIYATPTGFLASLRKRGLHSKTYLQRINAGVSNLDKLTRVEAMVDLVLEDRLDIHTARSHLAKLQERPPLFGTWKVIGAYGLTSMGMARILGGGWREMLLGTLVGFFVGLAVAALQQRPSTGRLAPLAGGLASALASAFLAALLPGSSQTVLALSGIIVLVPGLSLLVAMQELGTGHTVSGTGRLASTAFLFLLLSFGVGLGQRLAGSLAFHSDPIPLPFWTLLPALAVVSLGFLVVFQARLSNYGWILAATTLAWGTAMAGTQTLGPEAGSGLAALLLGSACNFYARHAKRPAAVVQLPSLMIILPGSLGFRGLTLVMHQQTLEGLEAGFHALFVTAALMLGLLVANALVTRRSF